MAAWALALLAACTTERVEVQVPPPPRNLACSGPAECEPWEECRAGSCAPLTCFKASDCREEGQSCQNGVCARARAAFCVQTALPPPNDCASALEMDFGSLLLSQSADRTLRITNTGNAPLTVAGIELVDAPAHNDFELSISGLASGDASAGWTLIGEQDLVATVHFQPTDATADLARLIIATDDPEALLLRVPILSSFKSDVQVAPEPAALDFGYVPTGDAETRVLAIQNAGGDYSVLEVKEILSGNASFTATPLSAPPHFMNGGEQLLLEVVYAPKADELVTSALVVRTNDPDEPEIEVPVLGFSSADAVAIVSTCPASATEGRSYTCTLRLADLSYPGPTWSWSLDQKPDGMTISGDASSATVQWTPGSLQLGKQPVKVVVRNPRGGVARQSFQVDTIGLFTLSKISPMVGSACGGMDLVLTGPNLVAASRVKFDPRSGAQYVTESPARVQAGKLVTTVPLLPSGAWYDVEIYSVDDPTNTSRLVASFLALPEIESVNPSEAALDQQISAKGCGLMNGQVWAHINPHGTRFAAGFVSRTATENVFVPFSRNGYPWASGTVEVWGQSEVASNPWPLTVTGKARLLSLGNTTRSGSQVTILGNGFDPIEANNKVRFATRDGQGAEGSTEVQPVNATETELVVNPPTNAVTGSVEVTVAGKTVRTGRALVFTGTQAVPRLLSVSHPHLGTYTHGTSRRIALFGSGFGDNTDALAVTVHGADGADRSAQLLWASDTALAIELPADLPWGPTAVSVTRSGAPVGEEVLFGHSSYSPANFGHVGTVPESYSDGLPCAATSLYRPYAPPVGVAGGVLFMDNYKLIRACNPSGTARTFYGKNVPPGAVATVFKQTFGDQPYVFSVDPESSDLWVSTIYALYKVGWTDGQVSYVINNGQVGFNKGTLADATVVHPESVVAVGGGLVYVSDTTAANEDGSLGTRLLNVGAEAVTRHGITVQPNEILKVFSASSGLAGTVVSAAGDVYQISTHVWLIRADSSTREKVISMTSEVSPPVGEGTDASAATIGGIPLGLVFGREADGSTSLYVGTTVGVVRRLRVNPATGRVDAGSKVDTVAGDWRKVGFAGDGGPAKSAALRRVVRPGVDGEGRLLIIDGCRIRRVVDGVIDTLIGFGCYRPPDGLLRRVPYSAFTVAVDPAAHRIFTDDVSNGVVWITEADSGSTRAVEIDEVRGLAVVGGTLFAYQGGLTPRIYRVDPAQQSPTPVLVAGNGEIGTAGDGDAATAAQLPGWTTYGRFLSEAASDLLVVADSRRVRAINAGQSPVTAYGVTIAPGAIERIAGSGGTGTTDADTEGAWGRRQALLTSPLALVKHPATGDLFFAEYGGSGVAGRVYRLSAQTGALTTLVGPPRWQASPTGSQTSGWTAGTPSTGMRAGDTVLQGARVLGVDRGGNLLLETLLGSGYQTSILAAGADGELTRDSRLVTIITPNGITAAAYDGDILYVLRSGVLQRHRFAP